MERNILWIFSKPIPELPTTIWLICREYMSCEYVFGLQNPLFLVAMATIGYHGNGNFVHFFLWPSPTFLPGFDWYIRNIWALRTVFCHHGNGCQGNHVFGIFQTFRSKGPPSCQVSWESGQTITGSASLSYPHLLGQLGGASNASKASPRKQPGP